MLLYSKLNSQLLSCGTMWKEKGVWSDWCTGFYATLMNTFSGANLIPTAAIWDRIVHIPSLLQLHPMHAVDPQHFWSPYEKETLSLHTVSYLNLSTPLCLKDSLMKLQNSATLNKFCKSRTQIYNYLYSARKLSGRKTTSLLQIHSYS